MFGGCGDRLTLLGLWRMMVVVGRSIWVVETMGVCGVVCRGSDAWGRGRYASELG